MPQQTSEFTVPVGDVLVGDLDLLSLGKRRDNFPQREQTFINLYGLFLQCALYASDTLPLAASQVYDLQLRNYCVVRIARMHLLQSHAEDRVGARRSQVHLVASQKFVLDPVIVQVKNIVYGSDLYSGQVFNCVYVVCVPFQSQALVWAPVHFVVNECLLFKHVVV